jgi:hypothetical protein
VFLPPYSPDLNPIENAFSKLKRLVRAAGGEPSRHYGPSSGKQRTRSPPPNVSITSATAATLLQLLGMRSSIAGFQAQKMPDGTRTTTPAGLLALPSNIGIYHRNVFAQVPEVDAKVSIPVFHHLTVSTGFSAFYWSKLLRPALQIDRDLDITQIPNFPAAASVNATGLAKPGVPFKQSDLVLLGISLGFEVHW